MISFRRNGVIFSPFVLLFSQCIVFRLTACDVQYSARVRKCHSFCRLDYCFFHSELLESAVQAAMALLARDTAFDLNR